MKNMQTAKCKFCQIVEKPRDYFDWIYYDDDNCVMGERAGTNTLLVYKKHGELPGGAKLNEMMVRIGALMDGKTEELEYIDGDHYRIMMRKKGE